MGNIVAMVSSCSAATAEKAGSNKRLATSNNTKLLVLLIGRPPFPRMLDRSALSVPTRLDRQKIIGNSGNQAIMGRGRFYFGIEKY